MTSWTTPGDFLIEVVSSSVEETVELGRRIASSLESGAVVAMRGGLGSGKTHLAKGIASGLGVKEPVTSPTYTIISEYEIDKSPDCGSFYHIDAYRLESCEDFISIGGMEVINSGGISVIEWSERIKKSLPQDAITVTITITGTDSRLIKIDGLKI